MEKPKKKLLHKLRYKYRLIIINDENFKEKFSFKLTPMNLFVGLSTAIVSLTFLVIVFIFFTPLREYVPGYTDNQTKRNIRYLLYKTDSLEKSLQAKESYYKNLLNIVNGGSGISEGTVNPPNKVSNP